MFRTARHRLSLHRSFASRHSVVLAFGLLLAAPVLRADETPTTLDDLSWLVGSWLGEGLGGTVEETWNPARAGVMVGTFRLIRDEETVFYEIMILREIEGRIALRLKHFHPDLTGWEEKDEHVTFPLESVEPGVARFSGLVLRRVGEDRLEVELRIKGRDGAVRTEGFSYRRVDL